MRPVMKLFHRITGTLAAGKLLFLSVVAGFFVPVTAPADVMTFRGIPGVNWTLQYRRAGPLDFSEQRCGFDVYFKNDGLLTTEFPLKTLQKGTRAESARVTFEFFEPRKSITGKSRLSVDGRNIPVSDVVWNKYQDSVTFFVRDTDAFSKRFAAGRWLEIKVPGRQKRRYSLKGSAQGLRSLPSCAFIALRKIKDFDIDRRLWISADRWRVNYDGGQRFRPPSCHLHSFGKTKGLDLSIRTVLRGRGDTVRLREKIVFDPTDSGLPWWAERTTVSIDGKTIISHREFDNEIRFRPPELTEEAKILNFRSRLAAGNRLRFEVDGEGRADIRLAGTSRALKQYQRCIDRQLTDRMKQMQNDPDSFPANRTWPK